MAELARKDEIAALRVERGTLTQAEYQARTRQSAVRIAEIRNQGQGYSGLKAMANQPFQEKVLIPTLQQYDGRSSQRAVRIADSRPQELDDAGLNRETNQTNLMLNKTLSDLSVLSNYQADFQQFGQTLSEGLKTAIESQNFTIQNQIKVDLDGRIVAEQTSEHQYQEMKRG
ncbi:Uncharacterised protein [Rodentibacter pneumotropicus]|uniref:Uncharacterized protein n=1 Tax=Rodentibacter pneumotropicus TaxID=758 RepID=A0A448MJU4_9PAST|nr:Uncharacterised protein [Rodentibacter pneumotropicus]